MQTGCVKDKGNVYAAGCFRCNESSFGCDFLAVDEQFFAVRLVHENAGYTIFFAGGKVFVAYGIGQCNFIQRIDFLLALKARCCADFRILNFNRLPFIVDVRMGSKQHVLTVQILEHDDLFAMQASCIKDKRNVYAAVFGFRHKYGFSCNFFAVNKQLLTGFFIHENAGRTVLFTGNKAGVRYRIGQRNFIERINFFFSLYGSFRTDFNRLVVEAYRSNFAFAEFYGLRVGKLIAECFLYIKFFDLVLILSRTVFVRVNRKCFRKDFACGIGRILGAVTILETCYAELDALDYAVFGSLYDLELCIFLYVDKIIAVNLAILGD